MHLPKSSLILLTTAALTSIAVAARPSSATPPATLDADVIIAQRDVDHDHAHEHTHSAHAAAIWTDEFTVLHDPYHHTYAESARTDNKVAKRATASASIVAASEDKEHSNWSYQGQKIPDTLATAYTEAAGHHSHHHSETKDRTGTHTKSKDPTVLTESHKTKSTSLAQPAGTSTKPAKRSYGTFEYVYDSTTKIVTAPHTTGHYDTSKHSKKTKATASYHSGWLSGSI